MSEDDFHLGPLYSAEIKDNEHENTLRQFDYVAPIQDCFIRTDNHPFYELKQVIK